MTQSELLSVLVAENGKRRENRKWIFGIMAVGVTLLIFLEVFNAVRKGQAPDLGAIAPLLVLFGAGAAFTTQHRQALSGISQLATREGAGFLVEALVTTDERDVSEICASGLIKALPLVESPDDLDDFQRGLFYRLFSVNYSPELVAAALECAKSISGAEGIVPLEKFYRAANSQKDAIWHRLGNRAQQILPDVRIRAARRIIEARLGEASEAFKQEAMRADVSVHN